MAARREGDDRRVGLGPTGFGSAAVWYGPGYV